MGRKKKAVIIATLILLMLLSLSAVIYPVLSSWYTERSRSQVRTEYQEEIKQTDKTEIAAARAAALEYNRQLFTGKISPADDPNQTGYFGLLNLTGNGIMGYVEIPKIDVNLPIYHTVSESVLTKGAGHMPQTSLPIGGINTHAAISAHTGLASSPMFTELVQLVEGDVFYITVLDEKMAYQVDLIQIVEPDDVSHIQIRRGEDLVTLITCTPYGINSHRLLVRGHRIELTEELIIEQKALSQQTDEPSVYWQHYMGGIFDGLLAAAGLLLLISAILFLRYILGKKKSKEEPKTMKNKSLKRMLNRIWLPVLSGTLLALPVHAAEDPSGGDVAGVVNGIWANASGQMQSICNNAVFPAMSWACGIGFVVSVIIAIISYRKNHTLEIGWSIALMVGLLVSLTAEKWVWALLGA